MPSLYLTQPGSRLELEHGRLVVTLHAEVLLSAPAARVDRVIVVGGCQVTTPVLAFLLDRGIDLAFLTLDGRLRGRLTAAPAGSLPARKRQYLRSDDPGFALALARAIVAGKVRNARTRCMELDAGDSAPAPAIARLKEALAQVSAAPDIATLMGIEGRATRWYFGVLREHLRPPWTFERRRRRPPPDPVNAVLSIVYTLLHEQCRTALEIAGLDPECGFLHQPRPGRASLALDLMEEFRPVIADTVAWTLFNRRMLAPGNFSAHDGGKAVRLTPDGWKQVAAQYTRRLDTPIQVPDRATRTTYRKLLEIQARQLRHVIEGDAPCYRPFQSR